jgi:hypothetical protein
MTCLQKGSGEHADVDDQRCALLVHASKNARITDAQHQIHWSKYVYVLIRTTTHIGTYDIQSDTSTSTRCCKMYAHTYIQLHISNTYKLCKCTSGMVGAPRQQNARQPSITGMPLCMPQTNPPSRARIVVKRISKQTGINPR